MLSSSPWFPEMRINEDFEASKGYAAPPRKATFGGTAQKAPRIATSPLPKSGKKKIPGRSEQDVLTAF
jgi:hypothetical protein